MNKDTYEYTIHLPGIHALNDRFDELEDFTAALDNDHANINKRLTHLEGQPASTITTASIAATHNRHIDRLLDLRDSYIRNGDNYNALDYAIQQLQRTTT